MSEAEPPSWDAREEFEVMVRSSGYPSHAARRLVAQAIVDSNCAPYLVFPEELVRIALAELRGSSHDIQQRKEISVTHQSCERLVYLGKTYLTRMKVLEVYFRMGGKRPPIIVNSTVCSRGYAGTWSLDEGRLHLTKIHGLVALGKLVEIASEVYRHKIEYLNDPWLCRPLVLEDIFPGFPDQVFAHWYSGEVQGVARDDSDGVIAVIDRGCVKSIRHVIIE